jgi:2-methylcitrate dehydratase PrpD
MEKRRGYMTGIQQLGKFIYEMNFKTIPSKVVDKTKTILLHNISVALAGCQGRELVKNYINRAGVPIAKESTIFFEGVSTTEEMAAFLNGLVFHSRAQDDVHQGSGTHIGCIVIPAALAIAESKGSTPIEFLEALVVGYETASFIGKMNSKLSTPRGFRSSCIYGPFASAAAASKLYGLSEEQIINALSLVANMGAGLNQTWISGSGEWRTQTALAAMHGIQAAKMAMSGFDAASDVLEGEKGFFYAFTGVRQDLEDRFGELGKVWGIMDVSFKPYPVCAINQVPVHLLSGILKENDLNYEMIDSLIVTLSPYDADYPGIDYSGPIRSYGAALMSLPFCLAVLLKNKKVTVEALSKENNESVLKMVQLVTITKDSSLPRYGCLLTVRLKNGQEIKVENRLGSSNFKYSWKIAEENSLNLLDEILIEETQFNNIVDFLRDIEYKSDLTPLIQNCLIQK